MPLGRTGAALLAVLLVSVDPSYSVAGGSIGAVRAQGGHEFQGQLASVPSGTVSFLYNAFKTMIIELLPAKAGFYWQIAELSAEIAKSNQIISDSQENQLIDMWAEELADTPLKEVVSMMTATNYLPGLPPDVKKQKLREAAEKKGITVIE